MMPKYSDIRSPAIAVSSRTMKSSVHISFMLQQTLRLNASLLPHYHYLTRWAGKPRDFRLL